jgi:hypothetical protein
MKRLPNSAFADPKARRFPITDRTHVRVAILTVIWRFNHRPSTESLVYLKEVHDKILIRADELGMDMKHECPLCDTKVKVQFT